MATPSGFIVEVGANTYGRMRSNCSEHNVDLLPDGATRICVHGQSRAHAPAILHLHGGAFAGSLQTGRPVATVLAEAGATVFAVDYPCGASHPFPQALEASYQALRWVAAKCRRCSLYVAGEESGGNLAAALALVARDRRAPLLAGQILLSPMLDPQLTSCSVRAAQAGEATCKWSMGWHDYLGTPDKACHPYAAPAGAQRLGGLAPALIMTGPQDPMRDEAEAYAAHLRSNGVPIQYSDVRSGPPWPDALMTSLQNDTPAWAVAVRDAVVAFLKSTGAVP